MSKYGIFSGPYLVNFHAVTDTGESRMYSYCSSENEKTQTAEMTVALWKAAFKNKRVIRKLRVSLKGLL